MQLQWIYYFIETNFLKCADQLVVLSAGFLELCIFGIYVVFPFLGETQSRFALFLE